MEYKRDEFALVYADEDDASAVGRLEEGDALYVIDECGGDDLLVTMKELRVRLHEISGKPFVDINPKLGMELGFLRPEHGVYVHASHRAFEHVRANTVQRTPKTGGGAAETGDPFKAALTNMLSARAAAEAKRKPERRVQSADEFAILCQRFNLSIVDKAKKSLVYAVTFRTGGEKRDFVEWFADRLVVHGIVSKYTGIGRRDILNEAMALRLFRSIAKRQGDGIYKDWDIYPEFFGGINDGGRLKVNILGSPMGDGTYMLSLEFTLV